MKRAQYIRRIRQLASSVDFLADAALGCLDFTPSQRERMRRAVACAALYAAEAEAAPMPAIAQALGELSVAAAARVHDLAESGLQRAEREGAE